MNLRKVGFFSTCLVLSLTLIAQAEVIEMDLNCSSPESYSEYQDIEGLIKSASTRHRLQEDGRVKTELDQRKFKRSYERTAQNGEITFEEWLGLTALRETVAFASINHGQMASKAHYGFETIEIQKDVSGKVVKIVQLERLSSKAVEGRFNRTSSLGGWFLTVTECK